MARSPAQTKPAAEMATPRLPRKKPVAKTLTPGTGPKKLPAKTAAASMSEVAAQPAPQPAPAVAQRGRLFAVTRSRGMSWDPERPLEQQEGWIEHAQFMNYLEATGFVVAGGPLEDTPYTFLAVRAENEAEARSRLAADPWEESRKLETTRIVRWDLKLGVGRL